MATLKKITTSRGNELEFATYDFLGNDSVVVHDKSCQMERRYTVGMNGELDTGEDKVIITSFAQVIDAWENERVWF